MRFFLLLDFLGKYFIGSSGRLCSPGSLRIAVGSKKLKDVQGTNAETRHCPPGTFLLNSLPLPAPAPHVQDYPWHFPLRRVLPPNAGQVHCLVPHMDCSSQHSARPGRNYFTVQDALEAALATAFQRPVPLTVGSRTDAGVNAVGLVAHVDLPDGEDGAPPTWPGGRAVGENALQHRLNSLLGREVPLVVRAVCRVPDNVHARFSARRRSYRYLVKVCEEVTPSSPAAGSDPCAVTFGCAPGRVAPPGAGVVRGLNPSRRAAWPTVSGESPGVHDRDEYLVLPGALDVSAIRQGARLLEGLHDFSNLCAAPLADTGEGEARQQQPQQPQQQQPHRNNNIRYVDRIDVKLLRRVDARQAARAAWESIASGSRNRVDLSSDDHGDGLRAGGGSGTPIGCVPGAQSSGVADGQIEVNEVEWAKNGDVIVLDFYSRSFLYRQVRMMTGLLVDIGRRRFPPSHVTTVLKAPPGEFRRHNGRSATAPSHPLTLTGVWYPRMKDEWEGVPRSPAHGAFMYDPDPEEYAALVRHRTQLARTRATREKEEASEAEGHA